MVSCEREGAFPSRVGVSRAAGAAFCWMLVEGIWQGMSSYSSGVLEGLGNSVVNPFTFTEILFIAFPKWLDAPGSTVWVL